MFVDLLARRYGLEPREVVEAVKWVQQHRDFVAKMKHGGWLSMISIVVGAAILAFWEGVKAFARGDK